MCDCELHYPNSSNSFFANALRICGIKIGSKKYTKNIFSEMMAGSVYAICVAGDEAGANSSLSSTTLTLLRHAFAAQTMK